MKRLTNLKRELSSHSFFKNNWYVVLLIANTAILAFIVFWSLARIHRTDLQVPVRFTSLANFDQLGSWYQLYDLVAIAGLTMIANLFLAIVCYRRNRVMSLFLLLASIMVAVLALAILLGFTTINYGTN